MKCMVAKTWAFLASLPVDDQDLLWKKCFKWSLKKARQDDQLTLVSSFDSFKLQFETFNTDQTLVKLICTKAKFWYPVNKHHVIEQRRFLRCFASPPGLAMLLRTVRGSLRRHLCSSSCIFSTLAGLRAQRQPLREVLPFLFSTFSKHLFKERLCRTEFFHPSGAVWKQRGKVWCWRCVRKP